MKKNRIADGSWRFDRRNTKHTQDLYQKRLYTTPRQAPERGSFESVGYLVSPCMILYRQQQLWSIHEKRNLLVNSVLVLYGSVSCSFWTLVHLHQGIATKVINFFEFVKLAKLEKFEEESTLHHEIGCRWAGIRGLQRIRTKSKFTKKEKSFR